LLIAAAIAAAAGLKSIATDTNKMEEDWEKRDAVA
jgi:hypothetical protein